MTDPRLTPAETVALDTKARRWLQAGGLTALIAVALVLAAIWTGDARYAYTGGIILAVAAVAALIGGTLNTPSHRKALAARLREHEVDRG